MSTTSLRCSFGSKSGKQCRQANRPKQTGGEIIGGFCSFHHKHRTVAAVAAPKPPPVVAAVVAPKPPPVVAAVVAPKPLQIPKATTSTSSAFINVKTPTDITKSPKIKALLKELMGHKNTLKLPCMKRTCFTKKAILNVRASKGKAVIEKYNELPQNIKDNLALNIYGSRSELSEYNNLRVVLSRAIYDGFYNP